jgi:hypothetical protein
VNVLAELLKPFATTNYACPLCEEWNCCEHKPVCDYEGDCPQCGTDKPRVEDALSMDPDAQIMALEIMLRHKGDMTTEAGDGFLAVPAPDGEHLSHKQGVAMGYPVGTCPKCQSAIDVPMVFGYVGRPCPKCGTACCIHCNQNSRPGGRSFPFLVRTYCRK